MINMKIENDEVIIIQNENNHVWIEDKVHKTKSHIQCNKKMNEEELLKYGKETIIFLQNLFLETDKKEVN